MDITGLVCWLGGGVQWRFVSDTWVCARLHVSKWQVSFMWPQAVVAWCECKAAVRETTVYVEQACNDLSTDN